MLLALIGAVSALAFITYYARSIEPRRLRLRFYRCVVPGLVRPVRLLFIADLHANVSQLKRLREGYGERIKTVDAILIGGDILHCGVGLNKVPSLIAQLNIFGKPMIAVLGNHDYMLEADVPALTAELERCGVRLLDDQITTLSVTGQPVLLILGSAELERDAAYVGQRGRERPAHFRQVVRRRGELSRALDVLGDEVVSGLPQVLLCHNPDGVFLPGIAPVLTLAGHTHGGQLPLAWWVLKLFRALTGSNRLQPVGSFRFWAGTLTVEGRRLIISRGLGGWPLRLNRVPEAHVIELTPT